MAGGHKGWVRALVIRPVEIPPLALDLEVRRLRRPTHPNDAMPVVRQQLPWHVAFGTAWFFLLFIAGTLSQPALMQPLITFLQDDLRWTHREAVLVTSSVIFLWVLMYVTSLYLLVLFAVWAMQSRPAVLGMEGVPSGEVPWR
jgi:hypothetical protein